MASCRDELIWKYFHLGYEYKLIVCFLYYVEGISISLRQLKRILQRLGLRRHSVISGVSVGIADALIRVSGKFFDCLGQCFIFLWEGGGGR